MRLLWLTILFLFSFQALAQEERPRVIAILPFLGPNAATFRDQLLPILDTDTRLLMTAPEPVMQLAKKYGYELSDLYAGDGVQIVARDSKLDGVVVGKVERVSGKYEMSLRVYDGGTGLSIYSITFTLPKQLLRQGEKEKLSGELLEALQEAKLSVVKAQPEESNPKSKKAKKEKKPKPIKTPKQPEPSLPEEALPEEESTLSETQSTNDDGESAPRISLMVGPALSGRFSTLKITDDLGVVLEEFEPSSFNGPAFACVSLQASFMPLAFSKNRLARLLVIDAGLSQSVGLQSNLQVNNAEQKISNSTNEFYVGTKLQVPVKNSQFALSARYTQQSFSFILPPDPALQADIQTALDTQGFLDMTYQLAEIGPEVLMSFANKPDLRFSAAAYADIIFSFGDAVLQGYGATRSALGGRVALGVSKKLSSALQANIDLQSRVWSSSFQGGGTLLDGRPSKLVDTAYESSIRLHYSY